MGEVAFSDDETLPADWRPALEAIAIRTREVMTRHPWMLRHRRRPAHRARMRVRHFDQTLEALSSLPLPLAEKLDVAGAVDEFVFGFCLHERNNVRADQAVESKMIDYVETLLETDAYPTLSALADELGLDRMWDEVRRAVDAPNRFENHLNLLLDGIEADIVRRRH